ncbi:MAG: hypothetical protein SGPRY_010234, partial [Prymnesium sp.]
RLDASRRALLQSGALLAPAYALLALPVSAVVEKKPSPALVAAEIERSGRERNAEGDVKEHVPRISFEGGKVRLLHPGLNLKLRTVFVVPHENLSPPNHLDGFTELMWLKDAETGAILSAKRLRPSDPSPLTLVASVPRGTKVSAVSLCSIHGLWQGTFTVP